MDTSLPRRIATIVSDWILNCLWNKKMTEETEINGTLLSKLHETESALSKCCTFALDFRINLFV